MQTKQYRQALDLARRELAAHNYPHAGELLETIAESGRDDPDFFELLAMLNDAEGRPMAAKQFYQHMSACRPH